MRFPLIASLFLLPAVALAQFPSPEIDTIFPPGGKAGTTLEVELTGTDLDDLTGLRFTHPAITARPVILPADEIWPEPRQDGLKFTVRIADNVPPGMHEVRTVGHFGLSTPRLFVVSPKDGTNEVTITTDNETIETATPIELEQAVNAQAAANKSDFYKLAAKKGQRILIHVWGERIDSPIDAILTVHDPSGKRVAASLNEIGLDPLGDFTAEADGEYIIKVSDYLYNGGPKFYYRMIATTAPWLDGIFPPAGKPGSQQKFVLYGRNLPGGQASGFTTTNGDPLETKEVDIQIPAEGQAAQVSGGKVLQAIAEGFDYSEGASTNALRIGLARDEMIVEDANLEEQTVKAPCEVVGRFDKSGDQDRYRFSATKGEELVIEVIAERMAIAADPTLILQQIIKPAPDAAEQKETNKFLVEADDIVMKSLIPQDGVGFDTRSRDARLLFTAPEDGDYRLVLGNNMSRSGVLAPYRLAIRKARPGFQLIAVQDKNWQEGRNAMPGVMRVNAGGTSFIRVLALREDGFDGPIELAVSGLPSDVIAPPIAVFGPNDEGYIAITASSFAQDWQGEIGITGKASLAGKNVSISALTGTLVWSAQDPTKNRTRSRLTTRFALQVSSEPAGLVVKPAEDKIWRVELKKTLELPVKITKQGEVKGPFKVTPYGLPGFTRPPSQDIPGEVGVLKINFTPNDNAQPIASEGKFVLRLDGVLGKYRANLPASEYWDVRKKEIDALGNRLNAAKGKADNAFNDSNKIKNNADKALSDHANARNQLAQTQTDAQTKHDAAKTAADTANSAVKAIPEAWLATVKSASDANKAAHATLEKAAADAKTKAEAAKKIATDAEAALNTEVVADAEHRKTLRQAVQTAKDSLKTNRDALAASEKALADHLAPRVGLANSAAGEEIRFIVAKRDAGIAASEIVQVTAEHGVNTKILAEAKTKADEALKSPQQNLANATKEVTDKESAKLAFEKTLAEVKTKVEATKKAAADANTAMTVAVAAHGEILKKLTDAKTNADQIAKEARVAFESAKSTQSANTSEDENIKSQVANAVADTQNKVTAADKSATGTTAAIQAATDAHNANLEKLTEAKTKADAEAKSAEDAITAATKPIADADAALLGLKKTQAEAQTKFDEVKKLADEATAAIPAEKKSHTDSLANLNALRDSTAQALQAAEPDFNEAAKRVTDYDANKGALEQAVTDAKAKIDPVRKVLIDAEAKLMETQASHEPAIAKLTNDKRSADIASVTAETAWTFADKLLAENVSEATTLANSLTDAQIAADAAKDTPGDPAKIGELTTAAKNATAALSGTVTALSVASQALAASDAAKPFLEQSAAEATARAEIAKTEADRYSDLVTRVNAAKTLAQQEEQSARNKANEKDVKFTVFSEPIDLRVLDPPATK
jgi:predicted  nucleic acid-binding Zn-ribbon protein